MNVFEQSGEAMLLAQDGQRQIAHILAAQFREWFGKLKTWHAAMPASLPPTESMPR